MSSASNKRLLHLFPVLALLVAGVAHADCLPSPAGLISWWRAEGSTYDQAGTNHAVSTVGLTYAPAAVDSGFQFAGPSAYLSAPDDSSLDVSDGEKLSFAAWMKVDPSASSVRFVLDKRVVLGSGCGARGYAVYLSDGRLAVQLDGPTGCGDFVSPSPDLRDHALHFVAVTIDRDVAFGGRIYVDGSMVLNFDASATSGDLSNSAPLTIGHYGLSGPDYNFQGLLDEIDLYRRILAPSEVAQLQAAGASGKCLPAFFFAEDLNMTDPPGAADQPVRPESLPNCRARQAEFLSQLTSPPSESFESDPPGALTQFAVGPRTVSLTGNVQVREQVTGTFNGTYPTQGNRFLLQSGNTGFTVSFDSPATAFGFMGTDIGDGSAHLLLVVHRANGTHQNIQVPNSTSTPSSEPNISGSALFFGMIDTASPFTGVSFLNPNNPLDGFGFDEIVIAGSESADVPSSRGPSAGRILVAPNPARGAVRFVLPGTGPARIEVRDVTGRTIWAVTSPGREAIWDGRGADGRRPPPGLYWVRTSALREGPGTPFVTIR